MHRALVAQLSRVDNRRVVRSSRRTLLKTGGLLAAGLCVPLPARSAQMIRIAVGRFREPVTLKADELVVRGGDGAPLATGRAVRLSADRRGLTLDRKRIEHQIVHIQAPELLKLGEHSYRRLLEVSWRLFRGRAELLVVHSLPLETYVLGVVSSELPRAWPYEALKVQAVAARTFAVWQKYRRLALPYHMESSVLDQVYHGAQREHEDARRAVEETFGSVMTWGRRPAEAYFHSTCGGHTESSKVGWGRDLPYLPGSKCGFCTKASRYQWREEISQREVDEAFKAFVGSPVDQVRVLSHTPTGRARRVEVRGGGKHKRLAAADLRRLIGYGRVWSTQIDEIKRTARGFVFAGRGAGHGVGMCQWGARGMSEAGHGHEQILQRYYPGVALTPMY
jgi:stage II sporulation protein D